MTSVTEKLAGDNHVTGEAGLGEPPSLEEAAGAARERGDRRAGILLIVVGPLLMALAAGEASAATGSADAQGAAMEPRTESVPGTH